MSMLLVILALLFCGHVTAQTDYSFSLLRQHDDLSFLIEKNKAEKNIYEKIKLITITDRVTLSWGGSIRSSIEAYIHEEFQNVAHPNKIWFLQRMFFHAHLHINNRLQCFAEINSSLQEHKKELSPPDQDHLGISQLFIKYDFNKNWYSSIGRESMRSGTGRLIDIREGPNSRRSFDMAKVGYQSDPFNIQLFYLIPVKPHPGVFDNDFLHFDETLAGAYGTFALSSSGNLDAYLLSFEKKHPGIHGAKEKERRYSAGIRHFGKHGRWSYDNELIYQCGKYQHKSIQAWALFLLIENESKLSGHPFRMGVKAGLISGDRNKDDNTLNTFNAMYPRGNYLGKIAHFGPANLIYGQPYIHTRWNRVSIELEYNLLWRYSLEDGIYDVPLTLAFPADNTQRFVGHQPEIAIGYQANTFLYFEIESSGILPGRFLQERGQSNSLFHFVLTTEFKF